MGFKDGEKWIQTCYLPDVHEPPSETGVCEEHFEHFVGTDVENLV